MINNKYGAKINEVGSIEHHQDMCENSIVQIDNEYKGGIIMKENLININDYRLAFLLDCDNVILLNKKHTIKEFQEEVNRAKEKAREDIRKYGDDWYFIQMNINKDFDYIELYSEKENNTIIF